MVYNERVQHIVKYGSPTTDVLFSNQ